MKDADKVFFISTMGLVISIVSFIIVCILNFC
jgi:hypothetical protein